VPEVTTWTWPEPLPDNEMEADDGGTTTPKRRLTLDRSEMTTAPLDFSSSDTRAPVATGVLVTKPWDKLAKAGAAVINATKPATASPTLLCNPMGMNRAPAHLLQIAYDYSSPPGFGAKPNERIREAMDTERPLLYHNPNAK
jgi:hypothetical protein